MEANYSQLVEMTDEEKFKMYMKLSKKEIIRMHIELEKVIKLLSPSKPIEGIWPFGYPIYDKNGLGPYIPDYHDGTAKSPLLPPYILT